MQHQSSIITIANQDDLNDIVKILNQAIKWGDANAYTKTFTINDRLQWFRENNEDKYLIYVFKDNDCVLGYLNIGPYRQGRGALRNTAEVSYYVDFDHHRKGVASALMTKAFEHCAANGIETLLAFLYNHNTSSIEFLKKLGFEQWGFFPEAAEANGQKYDHVIYGKKII